MKELLNSALGSSFFGQPLCLSYDNSLSKNTRINYWQIVIVLLFLM